MAEVVCQPIDYSHPSWAKRRRYRSPSPTPERSRKACREHPSVNVCLEDPPSGFIKEAMTFDGIASSIEAPQPPCNVGGDEGLTVAAWVKRSKDDVAWDRLIDFGNGAEKENVVISFQEQTMYEVRNGDGVQQLAVGTFTGPGASTQMSFPSDRWMHIALVHDKDGIASIYWNGALKARGPVWLPPPVHREKYYVGRSHWTHDPYFKGEISDVHVFNYALNHHEVDKACFSRSLPTGSRGKPILSLASGWRTDAPRKLPVLSWPSRGPTGHSCGCHGCGGFGHCGGGGGAEGNPLQFFTGLGDEHKRHALSQLQRSFQEQKSRVRAASPLQRLLISSVAPPPPFAGRRSPPFPRPEPARCSPPAARSLNSWRSRRQRARAAPCARRTPSSRACASRSTRCGAPRPSNA